MKSSANLAEALARVRAVGPTEAMREEEIAAGYQVVIPGKAVWLDPDDWPDDIVVSTDGAQVRIVAIRAKTPGTGAFRRLVNGIIEAGLIPVVVEPMLDMPTIMRKWGWQGERVGEGFHSHEVWTPPVNRHTGEPVWAKER